ncbi:MAG: winged helix DNA-binding domain-containing protein [Coriobacteriia bacterium]|jgi:hypothetical protein|nr:winged helix DNA-binding domain-containing protein [Coriobacteriia bacterium]
MTSPDFSELLGTDPIPWLLGSEEACAVWATLTGVLGMAHDQVSVRMAHAAVVDDPAVRSLVASLPTWDEPLGQGGARHRLTFLPDRLGLLADMGIGRGDFDAIEVLLDEMLEQQDARGRFRALEDEGGRPRPEGGSLACNTNVTTDVLLRFGRADDPRVRRALDRMAADLAVTPQGWGWQCVPEQRALFRTASRGSDVCPQVTLEGLRAFSHLPAAERPPQIGEAARTPLEVWRRRVAERPYSFGHGYQFKSVKWPSSWYDALWVLDTVGRYPEVWRDPQARSEDRRSLAELAACLIAYNFDSDGTVTPRRVQRGFEAFSFGQKHLASPFATARCLIALTRISDLTDEILDVDVETLPSSRRADSAAIPPRKRKPAPCLNLTSLPSSSTERAVTRVLARHHLGTLWEPASIESVVGDVVGVQFMQPSIPYLALAARLPTLTIGALDSALYDRRSLVCIRGMRGMEYVVRTDMMPVIFAATNGPVVEYARAYARSRGLSDERMEPAREAILDALSDTALTSAQIRRLVSLKIDVAAAVNLMYAEGTLVRDRPRTGWLDHKATYTSLATALPGVSLDSVREPEADVALVRAHIRAFGPVHAEDTSWWTGLGRKRTRRALDVLGDEIARIALSGIPGEFLVHAADIDELAAVGAPASPSIAFLPSLDPLLMGYRRRGLFIDDASRMFVFDAAGRATSVVLLDGKVVGVWDAVTRPEPRVLVHMLGEVCVAHAVSVGEHAAQVARFMFGEDVSVLFVPSMTPLTSRSAGAVFKPLR